MSALYKRHDCSSGKHTIRQYEIDFVVTRGPKQKYIQSAYSIPTAEKREQETFSLRHTGDSFRKVVITNAPFQTRTYDDNGIAYIGLIDFLLAPPLAGNAVAHPDRASPPGEPRPLWHLHHHFEEPQGGASRPGEPPAGTSSHGPSNVSAPFNTTCISAPVQRFTFGSHSTFGSPSTNSMDTMRKSFYHPSALLPVL